MNRKLFIAVAVTALRVAAQGLADAPLPPDEAEQKKIIADIKAKALEFDKNLPDFACTQLSRHSIDAKSMNQWKTLETVKEQLRFVHHTEEYKLLSQNGKPASGSEKRPSNLVSIKEFSDVLQHVFDPKVKAEFAWTQWDSVRGHRVHVLTFGLKKENSTFTVGKSKGIGAGLAGFIYADSDTNQIVRIILAATEVPANFPIQGTSMDMNYEYARIDGKIYVVPYKADLRWKEGKTQTWDEVELKEFKKP